MHKMINIRPLSNALQRIAENDLNELPSRVNDDLSHIEEWLSKQKHLNARTDRQWLLAFLRNSKFNLERTKEKLDYFYAIKSITPEFFTNKDPMLPELQEILKAGVSISLTQSTDEQGFPTVLIIKWKNADPNLITFTNLLKTFLMNIDVLLKDNDNLSVNGLYILQDMEGFSLSFVKHLTPTICKKAVLISTEAYPLTIQGIYFFNASRTYETFINLFKPYFGDKLKEKMKVFGENSFDKILQIIPLQMFPKEYGGEAQTYDQLVVEGRQILENHRDWFIEDRQYCSNEVKRPGKPMTAADVFGVEESFPKLNID